ncbi:MAG: hypothetical protein JSV49_06550 [Thermoplasmata archaeon]|nr:MAG: hypothetical protein JSV49_06550 [Thermoplasmata archaeon]
MVYNCGEEPGKGMYMCDHCGTGITLENDGDKLTPCPKCGKCEYNKG